MALIPQVKCGRCDRTYSGLRSRCPYCGAHRHKKGKRVSDGDNATWKLIIGVLLVVVLIAAVIVILVTSKDKPDGPSGSSSDPSGGVHVVPGQSDPSDSSDPSGSTGAQITVSGADGAAVTSLELTVGGTADLTAAATPASTDLPVWTTSDATVARVEAVDETGTFRVTAVAAGSATITVTIGTAKAEIPVTVTESGGTANPVVASAIEVSSQYSGGKPIKDNTLHVGDKVTYTAKVTPSTATSPVIWTTSNEEGVQIVPVDETGIKVRITCVGAVGYLTVTASIDGVKYEFRIQCKK